MPKLYTRKQGKNGELRYYADLRDIGYGQYALKPLGGTRATSDPIEAQILLAAKIEELRGSNKIASNSLGAFARRFGRDNPGDVTEQWLSEIERRLENAGAFFGSHIPLESITPRDVRDWLGTLSHLANGTQRHYLHALSSLYKYAQEMGHVPVGFNPVSGLYRKPSAVKKQLRTEDFFEIDEAARFLEAARSLELHDALFAAFLLTGGRRKEVLGLLVRDIDLDVGTVTFRPNEYRGLKRVWSERTIPLWPQLRDALEPTLRRTPAPRSLLFPGQTGGMYTDLRKPLRAISSHLGIVTPRLTKFRHTYATARLQTTDNGKQISLWTVAKELGHKTVARVEDTYGHPNHYRPRGEVVEYRWR